ncbi:MAG: hypothetical protein ACHQX3_00565 [Nitrospirales bacterium]|jgi:hypothetical protein
MPNLNETITVLSALQNDIRREIERLEHFLEAYAVATSGVVLIEKVIANLSEIANGTGE